MATATLDHSRVRALVSRIAKLDAEPARLEAVTLGLVDALLEGDSEALAAALDALRDARARADGDGRLVGWLDGAIAFAHWSRARPVASRCGPGDAGPRLPARARRFPAAGSADLRRLLETDEHQVSRTGRRLLETALVTRRKVGRQVFWQLTPRGRGALAEAPAPQRSPNSEFWQEALRRGFEGAYGDEPGQPRRSTPPASESSSARSSSQQPGIQATTWPQIADAAGVPLETVEALFPTRDDLFRSCGRHLMENLQFPPSDRAPGVFVGASSEPERIHRMVGTFFGAYERGADGITAGRRERKDVAVVDEVWTRSTTRSTPSSSRPCAREDPEGSSVAALRALTDLEVWRTLRDQGATPAPAVDQASAAVERWLEGQPAS